MGEVLHASLLLPLRALSEHLVAALESCKPTLASRRWGTPTLFAQIITDFSGIVIRLRRAFIGTHLKPAKLV
jgi:hypothetical protein